MVALFRAKVTTMCLFVCLLAVVCAEPSMVNEPEQAGSEEATDQVIEHYIEKVDVANALRKEIQTQLNRLYHMNALAQTPDEKHLISRLVGMTRKEFDDLDLVLNEFIPDQKDINEIVSSFRQMSADGSDLQPSKRSGSMAVKDWLKRNAYAPSNYKNRIPVIRTG